MNKKVEKAIGKALTASLAVSMVAAVPANAATATSADVLYKAAYNAVKKAETDKTQKAINEAREAIKALKGTKAAFAIGEFSKQVDKVQGPKFKAIVDGIAKAKASLKQADIDAVKALIEPELAAVFRNSYSSAADAVQATLNAKVDAAVKKAIQSQAQADIDAAKALVDDVKTAKPATIVAWATAMEKKLVDGTAKLTVVSVSATNRKEIVVTFNGAVDKDTVKKENFKINGSALAADDAVALNAEGNAVTITFKALLGQQTKQKVTVEKVKNARGLEVAETTVEVSIFDTTIPQAVKAEQVGPSKVKVTFSEPVQAPLSGSFKIDGGQYFIDGSSIAVNGREVTFELYTTLPVGEHKVAVSNVLDTNDYKVVDTELKFNVTKDEVKPTVAKVVKATPDQVVIEFTEDISFVGAANVANYYHTNSSNTPSTVTIEGKQLKLSFATAHKLPNGTAYIYVAKEVIKDGWSNKNDEIKDLAVTVTVDTTKPEVKEVKAVSDKVFEVTYTEDVQATAASNYKVLDSAGKEVTNNVPTVTALAANKAKLEFGTELAGSSYTLVVEKVKDVAGNEINKISVPVAVKDSTAPVVEASGALYESKKVAKISFKEAMNADDLLNLANYQLEGGNYLSAYKVTASVTDNGKAVLLDFSKETTVTLANGSKINVGKVRDIAGNATKSFISTVTLANQDTLGIGIDSVKATAKKTVEVTLKDSLSNFEADDFVLVDTTGAEVKVGSVTFKNADGKGVITYTLIADLDTDATIAGDSTEKVTVKTVADVAKINSANAFGVKVAANHSAVTAVDKVAAEFKTIEVTAKTVTIVLTEAVKGTTLSKYSFTVSGNTVTDFAFNDAANTVTLTLKDAVSKDSKVTVAQALDFEDDFGNVTKGLSKEVTAK